jgi:sporulation protein YlmC with PRC-barrel domain
MNQPNEDPSIEFIIGTEVVCDGGAVGELRRVIVDPVARSITHLVVEPHHRRGSGHLVPVALVASAAEARIVLRCTASEFSALDEAEEMQFFDGANGPWNDEQSQMFPTPYYPLGLGTGMGEGGLGTHTGAQVVFTERIPAGDVQVRRGDHVQATDGPIGHVRGLVVDPGDHCVTHILLDEGHLWGKKRVAIPISAVTRADDGVRLNLSKQEVGDLPAVDVGDAAL